MTTMTRYLRMCLTGLLISGLVAPAHADSEAFMTLTRTSLNRSELPTNTEVMTAEDFSRWSPQTAGDAARRLTSVQLNPIGGLGSAQTLQIRGASTTQNLVLIDGRPQGSISFASSQDLSEIPIETIDHLEVVRGGISSLYGPNAMGGVMNIVTKRAPPEGKVIGTAGYDYGSYGRNIFRTTLGAKAGSVGYYVYGDRQHESGFRQNSKADTTSAGGNVGIALPGKAGSFDVDASFYQAELGSPGQVFVPDSAFNGQIERQASTPNARQETDTKVLRLAYKVPLPMNSQMALRTWGSDRHVKFLDDFSNTNRTEFSRGGEAQFDLPLGLLVGGNFIHDREDNTDRLSPSSSFTRSVENYAFFAQDAMKWKRFTLIPSGRFDHHSSFGKTANPRVQAMADATSWLRFSGSTARSFRAPIIDDLYYPFTDFGSFQDPFSARYTRFTFQGNPDLKPEKAWTYDAGFELHNDVASLKATYFRANVSNLIQSVNVFTTNAGTFGNPDVLASQSVNVGTARRQGAEVQMNHKWSDCFRDALNYTYLENVGKPSGYTEYVVLAYSPRHTVNYVGTISPIKALDWSHTLRYIDTRYASNDRAGTKLGSIVLWDMRLAYRWNQLETFIQINDVTGRRYQEKDGYPLPGRTFLGGVTLRFGSAS